MTEKISDEPIKLDINNQMVLMRKHIKAAKKVVIQKLLRKSKQLEQKKTKTDDQSRKNKQRAGRLLEEVKLLKTSHPDKIFKEIIVSDWTEEDFTRKPDVPLQYRAHMRVAVVPFIQKKIEPVKKQVKERGKSSKISYTEMTKELNKNDDDDLKIFQAEAVKKVEDIDHEKSDYEESDTDDEEEEEEEVSDEDMSEVETDLRLFNPPTIESTPGNKDEKVLVVNENTSSTEDTPEHQSDEPTNEPVKPANTQVKPANTPVKPANTPVEPANIPPKQANTPVEPAEPDNKPVEPTNTTVEPVIKEEKPKPLLNQIAKESNTDDVEALLENIGKGYRDSEDEDMSSDGVDLIDDEISEDEQVVDSFFTGGQSVTKEHKFPNEVDKNKKKTKDIKMTSTFINLSSTKTTKKKTAATANKFTTKENTTASQQGAKKKKKNRPGQRARQLLSQGSGVNTKSSDKRNAKRKATGNKFEDKLSSAKRSKAPAKAAAAKEVLHPSWQASQQKKQQCSIQEFQGKRVVFDDSD